MNTSQAGSRVTVSQASSQQVQQLRSVRSFDDELLAKMNLFRFKMAHVSDRIAELIQRKTNQSDCTISLPEINQTISYKDPDLMSRLLNYLQSLSKVKMTVPDLITSPAISNIFSKNFSPYVEFHLGLINRDAELDQRILKLLPSKAYQGIYLSGIEIKNNLESLLLYIVISEFLILSRGDYPLENDNLKIETFGGEMPQQVSFLNPNFNNIAIHVNERRDSMYLLFLQDTLDTIAPAHDEWNPLKSEIDFHKRNQSQEQNRRQFNKTAPPKYDHLLYTKPDITLDIVDQFVRILDSDDDGRLTRDDIENFVQKKNLFITPQEIDGMVNEIFQRRAVKVESQRYDPIDEHELWHAMRTKYKKYENELREVCRPYRDLWLQLLAVAGLHLPRFGAPQIVPQGILTNAEANPATFKPHINPPRGTPVYFLEKKEQIYRPPYTPEAGILIQNTVNVNEVYIEPELKSRKSPTHSAFGVIINSKIKDFDKDHEFPTVQFNTKLYYQEANRLSSLPQLYMNEKINPITKFVPENFETAYKNAMKAATKSSKSGVPETESDQQAPSKTLEESMQPGFDSKKMTLGDVSDNGIKATSSVVKQRPSSTLNRSESQLPVNAIYGSNRPVSLTSSMKHGRDPTKPEGNQKPEFIAAIKTIDKKTLKALIAKDDPIVDPYKPPLLHKFRDMVPAENKPHFISHWVPNIENVIKDETNWDHRPQKVLWKDVEAKEKQRRKRLGIIENPDHWVGHYKLAPKERGMVDHQLPSFNERGEFLDACNKDQAFLRGFVDFETPFKLFHRSLRKTDKNLRLGEQPKKY